MIQCFTIKRSLVRLAWAMVCISVNSGEVYYVVPNTPYSLI